MGRTFDLDRKEADWQKKIEKLNKTVQSFDKTIKETLDKKQEAVEEMEKYKRWILTAKEMYGLSTEVSEVTPDTETDKTLFPKGDLTKLNIGQAIEEILGETLGKNMTATKITKRLVEAGFPTTSKDFRTVVFARLYSLTKKGKFIAKRKGMENYYSLKR